MSQSSSFESLPTETIDNVLRQLPDLECLDNLLRASPRCWRVFAKYGVDIMEQVLDAAPIDRDARVVVRTIAYIREGASSFPFNTIQQVRDRVTNDSISHRTCRGLADNPIVRSIRDDKWWKHMDDVFSPSRFPEASDPSTMRTILATSRRITFLTLDCLQFYLDRLNRLSPRRPADPTWEVSGVNLRKIRRENPPTIPCMIREFGPPTWIEEQVVCRALWRIQFMEEVKKAVKNRFIPDWSHPDPDFLQTLNALNFYQFEHVAWDLQGNHDTLSSHLQTSEESMVRTIMEYLDEKPDPGNPLPFQCLSWSRPWPMAQPQPGDLEKLTYHWSEGIERNDWVFERYMGPEVFDPFRRLGFAIWTGERLDNHAMTVDRSGEKGPNLLSWSSVLPDAAVEDIIWCERD